MGKDYRPDIDGLRAIAVVIVVLHHTRLLQGGFIGVDAFFVISGFLITRIILEEIAQGRFRLATFYRRRAQRLFPALFSMMAVSTLAAVCILFPNELVDFGTSLAYATFFVANVHFSSGDGYFADATDIVPLLHTWSLSVEEQYYLIFPLIVLLASKRGASAVRITIAALLFLSFGVSLFLMSADPSAAFYLFPPRAWELLVGCALGARMVPAIPLPYREPAAAIALAAFLLCAATYDKDMQFPGWTALVPCAAAAILIHSASFSTTRIASVLSTQPLVYLGLISYSLYLWHWPIIVFYKAAAGHHLSGLEKFLLIGASLAAAHLSWRFIERPFRQGSLKAANAFSYSAIGAATSCALAAMLLSTNGLASLYSEKTRRFAEFTYDYHDAYRSGVCFKNKKKEDARRHVDQACLALDPARPDFLILGDSHAAHYWAGFAREFPEINFLQATAGGCKPTLRSEDINFCREFMDQSIQFLKRVKVDAVILSARWNAESITELEETLIELAPLSPMTVVVGPIVAYHDHLPRLLARAAYLDNMEVVKSARNGNLRLVDVALADALKPMKGIRYISVIDLLCDASYDCATVDKQGLPLQFDTAHLTDGGAAYIAHEIRTHRLFDVASPTVVTAAPCSAGMMDSKPGRGPCQP